MATQHHETQALQAQLRYVVFEALDELNEQRAPGDRLPKVLDTPLLGERGCLDSLAFVNLIVILEQRLEERLGMPVTLLDDERLDPSAGQFDTVGDLIRHLEHLVAGAGHV